MFGGARQAVTVLVPNAITSSGERVDARYLGKLYIICLSYANLCFLNAWAEILDRGYDFLRKYAVDWRQVAALTLDVLLVATAVWVILVLALRSGSRRWIRAVEWGAIVGVLLPINVIRTDEAFVSLRKAYVPHALPLQLAVALIGGAAAIILLFNWGRLSARITSGLLLVMAPCFPLAVGNAAWRAWSGTHNSMMLNKRLQPALPQAAGAPRLIWIVFDEWDRALTLTNRPAGLLLPEIDRFRAEAFDAGRVYPPSRLTLVSVPSLLTGIALVDAKPHGVDEILVTYDPAKEPSRLTSQSTVFSEARSAGFNVGAVGWYLPYCRLFPDFTDCSWTSAIGLSGRGEYDSPSTVLGLMGETFSRQLRKVPLSHRLRLDSETESHKTLHATSYQRVRDDMLRTVRDTRLNLIFVHMCVPHLPAIYSASSDKFSSSRDSTYFDNLRLVDRTVRDLRQALEAAGLWDSSSILLTADHPLRTDTHYEWEEKTNQDRSLTQTSEVPYLLKMPGMKQRFAYDEPIQEVVTKRLVLSILKREVTTFSQVAAWLDHNPTN